VTGRHPGPRSMLRWFEHGHLQPDLAEVSRLFANLARTLYAVLGDGPELTAAMRKLLEAKDCAVRQAILDREGPPA
jgi:hypothetical protein